MNSVLAIIASLSLFAVRPHQSADILEVSVAGVSGGAGEETVALVNVKVKPGYHIQADSVGDEYLIPTAMMVREAGSIVVEKVVFPPPSALTFEGMDEPWAVFDGSFDVLVTLRIREGAPKGNLRLKTALRYQACDSKSCFPPAILDFDIPVEVR